jgi:hypothetical protein
VLRIHMQDSEQNSRRHFTLYHLNQLSCRGYWGISVKATATSDQICMWKVWLSWPMLGQEMFLGTRTKCLTTILFFFGRRLSIFTCQSPRAVGEVLALINRLQEQRLYHTLLAKCTEISTNIYQAIRGNVHFYLNIIYKNSKNFYFKSNNI